MLFNSSAQSLHWALCALIAVSSTGATVFLNIPACLGCLCVQGLFWIRLILKSQHAIAMCMFLCTLILGVLWYQALFSSLTCPFDVIQPIPSCTYMVHDRIGGYPLAAWGCLGSMLLGVSALKPCMDARRPSRDVAYGPCDRSHSCVRSNQGKRTERQDSC